jgi:hypothetical protein
MPTVPHPFIALQYILFYAELHCSAMFNFDRSKIKFLFILAKFRDILSNIPDNKTVQVSVYKNWHLLYFCNKILFRA